jgi:hypothetical protein
LITPIIWVAAVAIDEIDVDVDALGVVPRGLCDNVASFPEADVIVAFRKMSPILRRLREKDAPRVLIQKPEHRFHAAPLVGRFGG